MLRCFSCGACISNGLEVKYGQRTYHSSCSPLKVESRPPPRKRTTGHEGTHLKEDSRISFYPEKEIGYVPLDEHDPPA